MTKVSGDMPRSLRQRPRYNGLPIPFVAFVGSDGIPDLRLVDEYNRLLCLERRLCALCGQDLKRGREIVFIGDKDNCDNSVFIDPGMHEDCARYAITVWPSLIGSHLYGYGREPTKFGLYFCRGYDITIAGNQGIFVRAWKPTRINWDVIPELKNDQVPVADQFVPPGQCCHDKEQCHHDKEQCHHDKEAPEQAVPELNDTEQQVDNDVIVYDEKILGDRMVVARLHKSGKMLIGYDGGNMREVPFFRDPCSGEPWIPPHHVFVESVTEAVRNGEYDLEGDVVCLESFVNGLKQSIMEQERKLDSSI